MSAQLEYIGVKHNLSKAYWAVADRGFAAETLQGSYDHDACAVVGGGPDHLPDEQLADAAEEGPGRPVVRGKSGRVLGQTAGLHDTLKGVPSMYNKDLQESWENMLDGVKTVSDSVRIATGVLATIQIRPDRMRAALDRFILATDIADGLVRKGVLEQIKALQGMLN